MLLLESAGVRPGERVLDLGCEGEAVGFGVAEGADEICFVSSDVRRIRLCQNIIESGEFANVRAVLAESLEEISGGSFDVVLYRPVGWAAKERVFEQIDQAFLRLCMGGRLCLAGRRDRGVESYRKRLEAVFGKVEEVAKKGGVRVYRACKDGEAPGVEPVDTSYAFGVSDLPGGPCCFEARAGIFSRDGLDPGSRFLIETMKILPDDRVMDLGCGYGAIGIVAARLASKGETVLVDSDLLAIRCARVNLDKNGIANARAEVSDAFGAVSGASFDLILSNPPTHEGIATARPFVEGAAAHLRPGGRLMVVVMRPNLYRRQMKQAFEKVEDVGRREGYTILCARGAGRPAKRAGKTLDNGLEKFYS